MTTENPESRGELLAALVVSSKRTAEACESLRNITLWVWVFVPLIMAAVAAMFLVGYAVSLR
jgi:hypothetical protein